MADQYVSIINLRNQDVYVKDSEQRVFCEQYRKDLQAQIDSARAEIQGLYSFVVDQYYTIPIYPMQSGTLTYDGTIQSPEWDAYDSDVLIIGGVTSATDAGTYTVTFTPTGEYHWADGTQDTISITWTIGRAVIAEVPSQSGALYADGSVQSPTWSNYDEDKMTIGGTTSASEIGTYTATFTPTDNYMWADGTTEAKEVTWEILREIITVSVPSQSGTLTYTGSSQSPTWSNYDSEQLTIGGTTSGTNAGTYTATFTPNIGYAWSDGTTTAKSVSWTINKASVSIPSASYTYDGSSWSISYNSSRMTASGTTSATDAGTYTVTFTLRDTDNYQWSDGTTSSKTVSWTISKATPSITAPNLTSNIGSSGSGYFTYTGDGSLSVSSADTSIATVALGPISSGMYTVAAYGQAAGTTTYTISATAGNNYRSASASGTITVS